MNKKVIYGILVVVLLAVMVIGLAGCGTQSTSLMPKQERLRRPLPVLPVVDRAVGHPDFTSKLLLRQVQTASKLFHERCGVCFCHSCLPFPVLPLQKLGILDAMLFHTRLTSTTI